MKYHVRERPVNDRYCVDAWQKMGVALSPDWSPLVVPDGWWALRDFRGKVTTIPPDVFTKYYEPVE